MLWQWNLTYLVEQRYEFFFDSYASDILIETIFLTPPLWLKITNFGDFALLLFIQYLSLD